jgi:hypothetical protein
LRQPDPHGDVAGLEEEVREHAGRDTGVADTSSRASADCGQMLACLSRIVLPSTRFGAAIRATRAGLEELGGSDGDPGSV